MNERNFTRLILSKLAYYGKTKKELARYLNVTEKTCARYVVMPSKMPVWVLVDMSNYLNITTSELTEYLKGAKCTN